MPNFDSLSLTSILIPLTGENLGKNGSEGVVQSPIPFEVKNNRSGLGREALLKESVTEDHL